MKSSPVAIVGLSCRLPGECVDLASMWTLLNAGQSTVTAVPDDRWSRAWYGGPKPRASRTVAHVGAFLKNVAAFDAEYFDYPAEEAAASDPLLRILLELTIEALEDAGMPESAVRGASLGTYVGLSAADYQIIMLRDVETSNASSSKPYYVPNRIAHFLDARGPSIAVDSACSASLSALHLACAGLSARECDAALCMGGNVLLSPNSAVRMSQLGALSPAGECKPFDSAADGYGRADAAVVLVMKRLEDAIAANDRIYGVIRGSGLCHGGRAPLGPWAPRHDQQAALFQRVLAETGFSPDDIDYVEAHGTGTQVGDKEEALALSLAYGAHRRSPLPIGSVKRIFNHSEGAAGITGVLKALAMLQHRAIPPTPIQAKRTDIAFDDLGIRVADRAEPLDPSGRPPRIAVNSYGVAGAYAHVVIEGPPSNAAPTKATDALAAGTPLLFPLSARSEKALARRVADLVDYARSNPSVDVRDVAYTLSERRTHHDYRVAVAASDMTSLAENLANVVVSGKPVRRRNDIVFVFSGTGPQWWGMGRELLANEPVFRESLAAFDDEWQKAGGWSLIAEMNEPEGKTKIGSRTRHSTAAQVGLQVALANLWKSWGVTPSLITGHSLGEMAAAHFAGALSLADLAALTRARCDWQDFVEGMGTMAAVGLSDSDTARYIEKFAPSVDIAGINAPTATTVSGDVESITKLCDALEREGVFCRRLRVTVPFHSSFMRRRHDDLVKLAPRLDAKAVHTPFVSAVHGRRHDAPLDSAYWLEGFEQPVRFRAAIGAIVQSAESPVFVEIGPHPVLAASVEECLENLRPGASTPVLTSLRRKEPERATLLATAGNLFALGLTPHWEELGARKGSLVSLPRYPWQRQDYWDETAASRRERLRPVTHDLVGELARDPHSPAKLVATTKISTRLVPFLESHRIDGEVLYPAAAFFEGMRAAAETALESSAVELRDISVERPLRLNSHDSVDVRTVVDENERTISVFSSANGGATWSRHATAGYGSWSVSSADAVEVKAEDGASIDVDDVYRTKWAAGYHFGPHFRVIAAARQHGSNAVADLALHEETAHDRVMARVLVLDGALQAASLARGPRYARTLMLPRRMASLRFVSDPATAARIVASERSHFETSSSDITVIDAAGKPLAMVSSFQSTAVPSTTGFSWKPTDWLYREELVDAPLDGTQAATGVAIAIVDESGIATSLSKALISAGVQAAAYTTLQAAAAALLEVPAPGRRILVDARPAAWTDEDAAAMFIDRSWAAVEVIQQLQKARGARGVEVVWLTRGQGGRGSAFDLLLALRRTVEAEQPKLATKVVQTDDVAFEERLPAELLSPHVETEVIWTGNERRAVRIARVEDTHEGAGDAAAAGASVALKFTRSGDFFFATQRRRPLEPHEVRIETKFASLNFRDVMKLLGIYPAEPGDPDATSIGDEGFGIITEVGSAVRDFDRGDRVIVRAAGRCLASELCVPETFAAKVPASIEDPAAAAIPVVFTTAWYGLRTLAHVGAGERVLIHSAAGGVGLAAIQVAHECGAEVLATAGSEEKRAYLRDLGVKHVFSSKDGDMLAAIRDATGGDGVDVVLNSLAGAQMVQSIAALRDFGRFVELGKRDLYGNTNIGLFPFRRNLSYHALDMAKLWAVKPQAGAAVLRQVIAGFENKKLRPLPTKVFPFSDIRGAFEYFRAGTHVGKIVVDCAGMTTADLPRRAGAMAYRALVQGTGAYLVTGGLGGMGRVMVEWLVDAGARHIVVIARSAPNDDAQSFIGRLEKRGARIDVCRGSIANADVVRSVVEGLEGERIPLRGVIHTAGTLKDALVGDVTKADLETVTEAKVAGAWNLHQATRDRPLDFFMMFSSSATNGNAGQSVYSMANAFMNWLAQHRRSLGLGAQAIGWGPYMGGGMMSEELVRARLRAGVAGFTRDELVDLVDHVLPTNEPHVLVRPIDWAKFLSDGVARRYEKLRPSSDGVANQSASLREQLSNVTPEEASAKLTAYLQETVAKIRGIGVERVAPADTLDTLGFDSLGLVSLLNRIGYDLGVAIALFEIAKDVPLTALAEKLREKTAGGQVAAVATRGAETSSAVPLSPAQQRFVRCLAGPSSPMPVPALPAIYESEGPIDAAIVEEMVEILSSRHESLRATFSFDGGEWKQAIAPRVDVAVQRARVEAGGDIVDVATDIGARPWDISKEALLRCAVVDEPARGKHFLMVFAHHLAADAMSLVALGEEISAVYQALRENRRVELPPVPTSFSEWMQRLDAMRDPEREARARTAIDAVLAHGKRPRELTERVHSRVLRVTAKAATPLSLVASTAAGLREALGVPAVTFLHAGRTSPDRDLSRTVGALTLMELGGLAEGGPLDYADAVAFANALRSIGDEQAEAFYSNAALINFQPVPQRGAKTNAFSRWDIERGTRLIASLTGRSARTSLMPSTTAFVVIGQSVTLRVFSYDAKLDAPAFERLVSRVEQA